MVFYKLKYVLLPRMREEKGKELRKCILIFFRINLFLKNISLNRGFMGTYDFKPFAGIVIKFIRVIFSEMNIQDFEFIFIS